MNVEECRRRFASARVAHMATLGATGPHLVPVVFAMEDTRIYTAVDHKPKRSRRLRRLANIAHNPAVSLLVDHYEEDWDRLWWVRADGIARVVDDDEAATGLDLLQERYSQYYDNRPEGPVVEVTVGSWSGWSAR